MNRSLFGELRDPTVARYFRNRVAAAAGYIEIARLPIDCETRRAAHLTCHERLRLAIAVDTGDRIGVEARLQQVAFVVHRVSRRAVKSRHKRGALTLRRQPPHDVAEIGDVDVADHVDRDAADLVTLDRSGQRADLDFCAERRAHER